MILNRTLLTWHINNLGKNGWEITYRRPLIFCFEFSGFGIRKLSYWYIYKINLFHIYLIKIVLIPYQSYWICLAKKLYCSFFWSQHLWYILQHHSSTWLNPLCDHHILKYAVWLIEQMPEYFWLFGNEKLLSRYWADQWNELPFQHWCNI